MTQQEEQFKEGIFENSEFRLIKQLVDIFSNDGTQQVVSSDYKKVVGANSSTSRNRHQSLNDKVVVKYEIEDEEHIVEVDDDLDLEKAFSQDDDDDEDEFNHDDDDDVEYGQNRANLIQFNLKNKKNIFADDFNSGKIDITIQALEHFRQVYQNEYKLNEHKLQKYFDKLFNLIVKKFLCSEIWLANDCSNKIVYLTLCSLRILLRNYQFQKQFLLIKDAFSSLAKIFLKYIDQYSTLNNQIVIYAHILDQLLSILTKVILSETNILMYEQQRNGSGTSRNGSSTSLSQNKSSTNSLAKEISKNFFEFNLHVSLIHLIDTSNDICLIHGSLSLLIQISNIDNENKSRIANDLDISDQLLVILQEYDENSKKLASKLLLQLCIEEKIKSEITHLDGIQVLLSLLHNHNHLDILWNIIWCLVQLCSYNENKKEIRLVGGLPVILSILCEKSLDSQLDIDSGSTKQATNDLENSDKRSKAKFQIQAACCALVGELAFNETNSYQIVNTNGVYLVASKLLISRTVTESNNSSDTELHTKEIERLHCNAWRTLRLMFSAERHRSLIKKIIPFNMFEQFVDIGNYKKDLKLYQPLLESFYKLNKDDLETMKQQIRFCNQTQSPTNYINEYAVYEMIGSGAFGRVHKVKKKNSNYFLAMKEIQTYNLSSMKDKSLGEIVNEVTIIRNNLKHPNIVRYFKTFKENDNLYIVMELIDGEPLSQHVRTLREKQEFWNEDKIWNILIQIVLALKYLHKEKHIVHRDLTSNNIMLSENDKITITDFGLAKLKESDCSKMLSVVGTMFYSCPEIIKNEPYNEKADIWALGCVFYEICCLEPPFYTLNMLALANKITQSDYDQEKLKRFSYSSLVSLVVQNCLIIDPTKRPDIIGVASIIAEKILNYTDTVRYKCNNLEKKLEKEKNKTQKMFCSKQEINYQQRNQAITKSPPIPIAAATSKLINSNQPIEQIETNINEVNKQQGYSSTSSVASSSYFITESKSEIIQMQNNDHATTSKLNVSIRSRSNSSASISKVSVSPVRSKLNNADSNENISVTPKQQQITQPVNIQAASNTNNQNSSSPNAKLPPIRHPKSKLILKNMQNKQQIQQLQHAHSVESNSTVINSNNNATNREEASNLIINALENEYDSTKSNSNPQSEEISSKIQRSSSSSVLEKRPSQTKKNRPNSANSGIAPVYKKLLPIEDPILQILDQLHKIIFITQLPPSGKKNFKRKLVDRYKRFLFSNKRGSSQIKTELMKLIKNSPELIDMEMIGLKSFQYYYNSSDIPNSSNSSSNNPNNLVTNINCNEIIDSNSSNLDMIINQNGLTYEQLQNIIEELLSDANYHLDNLKYLREELPSID